MDEKELRQLLGSPGVATETRGWRCPDDAQLAAYAEGCLPQKEAQGVESHLADCNHCISQIAFLIRRPSAAGSEVPPRILARARGLVESKPSFWGVPGLRWGTLAAAAACVVLVFALQLREPSLAPVLQEPAVSPPVRTTPPPAAPVALPPAVRNSERKPPQLTILSPADGAIVATRELEFRWLEVPGRVYYEIHVVTEEGNVVWQDKVEGTRASLPGDTTLEAGQKYFVWVRAYLSGGGALKSEAVAFRVATR